MDKEIRLGQEIRQTRKKRRMSQSELAEKAGLALMTISRLERGEHDPHMKTLVRITRALDVPLFELMRSAGYFNNDDSDDAER